MKANASPVVNGTPPSGTVAEQIRLTRQRLLESVMKARERRARGAEGGSDPEPATTSLVRAVAAVADRLPTTGAVTMNWDEAMRLVQLDKPSTESLRELQDELRKAHILFAFGSHVVSFARDAG